METNPGDDLEGDTKLSIEEKIQQRVNEALRNLSVSKNKKANKEKAKREERRREEEEILNSVRETSRKNKLVLEKAARTEDRVRRTLKGIEDFQQRLAQMRQRPKIEYASIFSSPLETTFITQPEAQNIVDQLVNSRNIVVIAGENRDPWEIEDTACPYNSMFTLDRLQDFLLEFWQYIQSIRNNQVSDWHHSIAELIRILSERQITLITQNVDGILRDVVGCDLIELNGNANFMRCTYDCNPNLYITPQHVSEIPICPECSGTCRPHVLVEEEMYEEEIYKSDTAAELVNNADCIVLADTHLTWSLPRKLIERAIAEDKFIVEIGPSSVFGQPISLPELLPIIKSKLY